MEDIKSLFLNEIKNNLKVIVQSSLSGDDDKSIVVTLMYGDEVISQDVTSI